MSSGMDWGERQPSPAPGPALELSGVSSHTRSRRGVRVKLIALHASARQRRARLHDCVKLKRV
jgi:hypothetical protein